nr:PRC-barrel domain-containing protein [Anaerolineae bacterium]
MDLPLDVEIYCTDGLCGHSTRAVIDPIARTVTHLVVKKQHGARIQVLVPVEMVTKTSEDRIVLRCQGSDLIFMESFLEVEFLPTDEPFNPYAPEQVVFWPYVLPDEAALPVMVENLPPDEVSIRRGSLVRATNGRIGRVDELLVNPADSRITHLVLREGHLWGQQDVTIPVPQIDRIDEDTIFLKLTRQEVEALPTIPVHKKHRS